MKLIEVFKQSNNAAFVAAHLKGTDTRAPRVGYYFIRNTYEEPMGKHGMVLTAIANWKANIDDYFIEDEIMPIAIKNLFPHEMAHLKNENELIGKTIYIYHANLTSKEVNGTQRRMVECLWYFVDKIPQFINGSNAAIHAFFDTAVNGKQAYEQMVKNAPYDILDALDYEAQHGYSGDVPLEKASNDDDPSSNDAYDAPIDGE